MTEKEPPTIPKPFMYYLAGLAMVAYAFWSLLAVLAGTDVC